MPGTFEELGVAPELVTSAQSLGWAAPSRLQRNAVPVIRRGNNAVLHAGAGAGVAGAYGLGVLDRLHSVAGAGAPRALVLTSSAHGASAIAASLARLTDGLDVSVRARAPGWPDRPADVLVASVPAAMDGVRDSSLKLESLVTVIVHGAELVASAGDWEALETLLEAVPAEAQRILATSRFGEPVDGLIERHVRKAMTIPPRPADDAEAAAAPIEAPVGYMVVPERDKTAAVVALLSDPTATEVAVVCRDQARADVMSRELGARGVAVGGEPDEGHPKVLVLARTEADQRTTRATVVSCDVPMDADELGELHGRGGTVLATPRELSHLRLMAGRAGATLEAIRLPTPPTVDAAQRIRARLAETLETRDLGADLALLEPLLEEHSAIELAAAALHLARTGAGTTARDAAPGEPAAQRPAGDRTTAPAAPPPTTSWVRLFISAGSRDGLGPGDLVGAITGESGLKGEQVGKIEVRESHSTVEVPGDAAEAVIQALNGRSLRGRSLRVDYDRKERTQRRPAGRGGPRAGGPPRSRPKGRGGPGERS